MSSKETFTQISPSEFFYRNRDLAGFSNPTRSLYTAVREFVENSLDACDQKGILADVHMSIKAVDAEKPDPKQYILTVRDNGPGIESDHVPLAFGTVLYRSKFGLIIPCKRYTTFGMIFFGVFFNNSTKIFVSSMRFVVFSFISNISEIIVNSISFFFVFSSNKFEPNITLILYVVNSMLQI